jgi:hypothetical protein
VQYWQGQSEKHTLKVQRAMNSPPGKKYGSIQRKSFGGKDGTEQEPPQV